MFILEKNRQCNILGSEIDRFRFRFRYRYLVSRADDLPGAASCSVQQDVARLYQHLNPCTRKTVYFRGQEKIEALLCIRRSNDDLVGVSFVHHFASFAAAKKIFNNPPGSGALISDSPISAA